MSSLLRPRVPRPPSQPISRQREQIRPEPRDKGPGPPEEGPGPQEEGPGPQEERPGPQEEGLWTSGREALDLRNRGLDLRKSSWAPLGEPLGESWPLGALLEASGPPQQVLETAPGRPEGTEETGFELIRDQIPSQNEPRRVPNRGPKAIQAENCEALMFSNSCKDFNDFSCPRLSF